MTWSEAVLWLLGGGIALGAGLADDSGFLVPGYLQVAGALGMGIGAALFLCWRRGGATRPVLGGLAYLGTALVTSAVVAGGPAGDVFVPLYGFVAVVAAIHMRPAVAVRHLAVIVAATALLVALGDLTLGRAAILLTVVVVMAAVVGEVRTAQAEMLDEHERQEAWRAAMIGALAHDIRSPLTVVRGVLATLGRHPDSLDAETREQLLGIADRHASRIQGLSDDLLAAERVRHGRLALQTSTMAATDLLGQVAAVHSGPVELDVPQGLEVWADGDRLTQVLLNLLRNAAVHGEPPVELTAHASNGGVRLEVRDHGPGVDPELAGGLFDSFTGGGRPDSVGLGLWIVRMLVEAHGGWVRHEQADPGARFMVWLPGAPATAPTGVERAAPVGPDVG